MNGWWIAAGIAALVLSLLLWPVEWRFSYNKAFSAEVRWLFLRFPLTGRAEKKPRKTKVSSSPAAKKTKPSLISKLNEWEQSLGASTLPEALSHLGVLLRDIAHRTRWLLKHSALSRLEVSINVGGADAADAAMVYGTVCAAVYPLVSWGTGLFRRAKQPQVAVRCDFDASGITGQGALWVLVTPLGMLVAGIGWIITYVALQNKANTKEDISV